MPRIYSRFEIPDQFASCIGGPYPARDLGHDRDVVFYRWSPSPSRFDADSMQDRARAAVASEFVGLELFSDGGCLYLVAADAASASPALEKLRQVGMFPELATPPPLPPEVPGNVHFAAAAPGAVFISVYKRAGGARPWIAPLLVQRVDSARERLQVRWFHPTKPPETATLQFTKGRWFDLSNGGSELLLHAPTDAQRTQFLDFVNGQLTG